jgi:hypothetical protein
MREGTAEAAPRLDGGADDDELGTTLCGDARNLYAEAPRASAGDLAPHAHAVGARHGRRGLEPLPEAGKRAVHAGVQRQLALDRERRDENDPSASVRCETAGEIERVLGLLPLEQRHDDAAVADRARPAREAPGAAVEHPDVGQLHRSSW